MNRWSIGIVAVLWFTFAGAAAAEVHPVAKGCKEVGIHDPSSASAPPAASGFPLQLETRVPFEPTAFPSDGRTYVMYELYLSNFATSPLTLSGLQVLDADAPSAARIAAFEPSEFRALLRPVGAQAPGDVGDSYLQLAAGRSDILFLCLAFGPGTHVPNHLRHRIVMSDSTTEGAVIDIHHAKLHVLGAPLMGANWLASDGPSNDESNHHRRGVFVSEGRASISRRYAIDWQQTKNGETFSGDPLDKRSYYSYGKPVLAVADSRVIVAKDGLPDNAPGHNESFHPATPITMATVGGNRITLDLGSGQFAQYMHLQPGTLRVKAGDRVRRGQVLARVGSSGDAREPHLHFQVTTSSSLFANEGLPYLIEHYRIKTAGDSWQTRSRELPLGNMLVDFGPDSTDTM